MPLSCPIRWLQTSAAGLPTGERAGHGATTIVPPLEEAYRAFDINPVFR
jgi:hypothetical protein